MQNIAIYHRRLYQITFGLLLILAFWGNLPIFILTIVFITTFLLLKTFTTLDANRQLKFILSSSYLIMMILQIVFNTTITFSTTSHTPFTLHLIAALLLPLPFLLAPILTRVNLKSFYLPSVDELETISFAAFQKNQAKIQQLLHNANHFKKVLRPTNLQPIFSDLHRHSATHYINNGTLNSDYFKRAAATLDDPYLYIAVSNTGSAASELIALFTQKQFNHTSLSFDPDLDTIISYNGGERVYPPGLNPEMVASFHKKPDASILIYRLPVTRAQKQTVLDTISKINETGSAYNILGLVTKHSLRRNIMFCSQFVYKMLQIADITYFEKQPGHVQPTDFIELDYHRQLEYVSEIKF
ncbi:hypothetical protein ACFQ5M_06410 [Agrilactobacillus yilanensis]|uniref:Uncharacterized protein n=1 Tax=Agrilactobacillus yilanensis TaxID=2485997 RepID=A0ABW4J6A4_9LACO|nr:hypothetical protein [Agrilactobacillus yilanensis]